MLSLLLAAIFFAGIHLGVAGTTIRDRAIGALGQIAKMHTGGCRLEVRSTRHWRGMDSNFPFRAR